MKKGWKKGLLVFLLCTIALIGYGCTKKDKAADDNVLNYGSTKDIRDLNPHLYGGEMAAQNIIFEGLTKNENGKVKPCLATSWDISEDGKKYTFHLRKGVKFTDGEKFNAQAVKANFDAILANRERHAWLELVKEIEDTKVIDDYTFEMTLKNAYYPTLVELGLPRPFAFISPKSFKNGNTKDGVKSLVGTGPYILKKHTKNKEAVFEANDDYWGTKPKIQTINWKVIPNIQTLFLSLKKGDIDLIYGADGDQINMDTLKDLKDDKSLKVYMSKPNASRSVLLNTTKDALKNVEVRKAITMGINKDQIVKQVLNNMETVATNLLPKTTPYCDIDLPVLNYNPDEANQILDKAGYIKNADGIREKDGQPLKLTFAYNSQNAQEGTIAQVIQSDLKKIGIQVDILSEEKQAYLNRQQRGDFDMMYSLSWGAPYDPQSYLSSWRAKSSGHGDYQAQLGLAKKQWLDDEISKVLVSTNEAERAAEYKEILTYINEEHVYVPLSYSKTKAVANKKLKGVTFEESQYEIPFASMSWK